MAKKKELEVLLQIGDIVRVVEVDRLNVEVQRMEKYYSPIAKKEITGWRFNGYSRNVVGALRLIHRKRLLDNTRHLSDLAHVLETVLESDKLLESKIEELKEG